LNSSDKAPRSDQALPTWKALFEDFRRLEADQLANKEQGLNDFNLLGSVLSANDEVRLHTRFLFALLNPKGKHYRGSQFLDLFLKNIGRERWLDLNSDSLEIRKEYFPAGQGDQIDLYISDGKRTIVIENKLNALDQPGQVKRYLRATGADSSVSPEDTLFIYLTKGQSRPSPIALAYPGNKKMDISPDPEPLCIFKQGAELFLGTSKEKHWALYQNLTYRGGGSIHGWLDACEKFVVDVVSAENILWAIRDYRNVVKRATKEYSSNVKSLKEHFEQNQHAGGTYHQKAIQMAEDLRKAHIEWLDEAMTEKLNDIFKSQLEGGTLLRIGLENSDLLEPFLSSARTRKSADLIYKKTANFFTDGRTTNRGSYFLVNNGDYKGQVVLMLYYGRQNLHVGCIFLPEGEIRLDDVLSEKRVALLTNSLKSIFGQARTQTQPLEKSGIMNLANFENSPQRELLRNLAKVFAPIDLEAGIYQ